MRARTSVPTPRYATAALFVAALFSPLSSCPGVRTAAGGQESMSLARPVQDRGRSDLSSMLRTLENGGRAFWNEMEEMKAELEPATLRVALRNQIGDSYEIDIPEDGVLGPEAARQVAELFRCRRSGRRHRIAPELVAMLFQVAAHYPGREIEVVSGYRRPPYASRTSKHAHGDAIDLRVEGVRARHLRDFVWGRYKDSVGVGFYIEQGFVHMDTRSGEDAIAWTQRHYNDPYRYDPPWSRRRREVAMIPAPAPDEAAETAETAEPIASAATAPSTDRAN